MAARKPNPKLDLGPDYVLQQEGEGHFYGGRHPDWQGKPEWVDMEEDALRLRGPGLASAERALARRGYVTRRVLVNAVTQPKEVTP